MSRANLDHTEHLTIIKNTKDFEIKVLVFEQLPRSEVEKIKVRVVIPELKDTDKSVVYAFLRSALVSIRRCHLLIVTIGSTSSTTCAGSSKCRLVAR